MLCLLASLNLHAHALSAHAPHTHARIDLVCHRELCALQLLTCSCVCWCRFVRPKTGLITSTEVDFIESFQCAISVPDVLPEWLWRGVRILKHPTIPLKYASDRSREQPSAGELPAGSARAPATAAAQTPGTVSLAMEALDISMPWPKHM